MESDPLADKRERLKAAMASAGKWAPEYELLVNCMPEPVLSDLLAYYTKPVIFG